MTRADFFSLWEHMPEPVLVTDAEQVIRHVNPLLEALVRRARSELVGEKVDLLLPTASRSRHAAIAHQFIKSGEQQRKLAHSRMVRVRRGDGIEVPIEVTISSADVEGQRYFALMLRDLSEQLALQDEVAALTQRLARIERMEALSTLSAGLAHQFSEVLARVRASASRVATALEGGEVSVAGREVHTLMAHVDRAAHETAELQLFARRDTSVALVDPQGPLDRAAAAARLLAGAGIEVIVTFDPDLPRVAVVERELEQAVVNLQRTREQLVQREKLSSLGEFVAGVTHELNNPLTAIIGYAEMLQAAGLPAQQGEDVAAIVNGAQRCQRIVRNLLGFARQHKPERRPVCLNALVEDVLGFMGYELRTGNVTVERALEPDLPACEVDPHQIQQVLLNILSNARQALEGYRKDARIEVRTARAGDRVQVILADNGPGIPAEHLRRVFDPFFTTKPAGRGTGLGLSLAYGIVQEHGGTITADSTPGAGARFTLEFPAASLESDPRLAPAAAALPEREGEGVRVLVVDDEPAIRDLIRSLLTPRGYVVSEASDGEAALRWLGERRVDLVVCDLRMPGLGGLPFFERLKVERPELAERVIFMTGDVMNPVAQQLAREQGRVCLAKPFSGDEFRRALHRVRQSCT